MMDESKNEHIISHEFGTLSSDGIDRDDKENNKSILVESIKYANQGARNPDNLIKLIKQKLKTPFFKK